MDIWEVGTLNQLFVRDSYTETTFSKKKKWQNSVLCGKPILYLEMLHGNVAFSIIIVLSS